jgi:hypothetical protein
VAEFPRVRDAEADGKTKATFQDIKLTLGIAAVGDLFEELANYPWYLQLAWRNLKPNASTVYFQRMTRELADMALRASGTRRSQPIGEDANLSPEEARLDLDAKLVASAAAIRYGTNGQLPKMLWLSAQDKQTAYLTAASVVPAPEPEPSKPDKLARDLRQHAALCAESLPYRMEISASACRQSGLTEDQIDSIRQVVNAAWDVLPRRLAAAAVAVSSSKPLPEPANAG